METLAFETLPPLNDAEQVDLGAAIDWRHRHTVQVCVFCGDRALFHYVAHEMNPPRWMDVCFPHSRYLRGQGPL